MSGETKGAVCFVDSFEYEYARLITEDGTVFDCPIFMLPEGTREGNYVEITAISRPDMEAEIKDEIDSLLDDLGDNP